MKRKACIFLWEISHFLVYKNATIAIAFELSSLHSETQIGENKGRLTSLCSILENEKFLSI